MIAWNRMEVWIDMITITIWKLTEQLIVPISDRSLLISPQNVTFCVTLLILGVFVPSIDPNIKGIIDFKTEFSNK